jgi:hypothetical protein
VQEVAPGLLEKVLTGQGVQVPSSSVMVPAGHFLWGAPVHKERWGVAADCGRVIQTHGTPYCLAGACSLNRYTDETYVCWLVNASCNMLSAAQPGRYACW